MANLPTINKICLEIHLHDHLARRIVTGCGQKVRVKQIREGVKKIKGKQIEQREEMRYWTQDRSNILLMKLNVIQVLSTMVLN